MAWVFALANTTTKRGSVFASGSPMCCLAWSVLVLAVMSSTTPPSYEQRLDEPSMVVDPGLYEDVRRAQRLARATSLSVRVLACVGVVGVTVFSLALADRWLSRGHASAHAAESRFEAKPTAERRAAASGVTSTPHVGVGEPLVTQVVEPLPPAPTEAAPTEAAPIEPAPAEDTSVETLLSARRSLKKYKLDEAEAAYRSVLRGRTGHPGALAGMARVAMARGDLDGALRLAKLAVAAAPSHAVYHLTLAEVLRLRSESAAAEAEFVIAERLSGTRVDRGVRGLAANPY